MQNKHEVPSAPTTTSPLWKDHPCASYSLLLSEGDKVTNAIPHQPGSNIPIGREGTSPALVCPAASWTTIRQSYMDLQLNMDVLG